MKIGVAFWISSYHFQKIRKIIKSLVLVIHHFQLGRRGYWGHKPRVFALRSQLATSQLFFVFDEPEIESACAGVAGGCEQMVPQERLDEIDQELESSWLPSFSAKD